MSAYVVDRAHIAALVRSGLELARPGETLRWFSEDPRAMVEMAQDTSDYYRRLEAIRRELRRDRESVSRAAALLAMANVASVQHRYPSESPDALPGAISHWWTGPVDWPTLVSRARRLSPEEMLLALSGYEYQSCEHPGWFGSEAWRFVDALRDLAIRALPGYQKADTWSIEDPVTV